MTLINTVVIRLHTFPSAIRYKTLCNQERVLIKYRSNLINNANFGGSKEVEALIL